MLDKVWLVIEEVHYEPGPTQIIGAYASEESATRVAAANDDYVVHEVDVQQ